MLIICSINVVRSWLFLLYFCFFFIAVFLILLLFLTVQYLSANFSFIFAVGWAHVICALYIPEVRFGDVHSMDPVILNDVPLERFFFEVYWIFSFIYFFVSYLSFFLDIWTELKKKKQKEEMICCMGYLKVIGFGFDDWAEYWMIIGFNNRAISVRNVVIENRHFKVLVCPVTN